MKTAIKQGAANGYQKSSVAEFFLVTMNLSWQLAIIVLVPFLGGYKLDQNFATTPLFTVVGLILVMFGSAVVLGRLLKSFGPPPKDVAKDQQS